MAELSNAVTVLIARMESHPEDFNVYNGELYNKAKFGETAGALYGLVGMDAAKAGAYWFLTDADKEALTEAWKKYHRVRMEKEVMEKIFADGAEEREREMERLKMRQQMYQAQQAAMAQGSLIHPMQNSYPYTANANAAQGMAIRSSAAQNATGLTVHSNGAVQMSNTLQIGKEMIDESLITKLKKWVEEK
jgi:hypothetical protein